MSGPLTGLKVLEFTGKGAVPYAAMLMADLGADVLRLDRVDASSFAGIDRDLLNRSRTSIPVDLKSEQGHDLVVKLSETADALIEGFRPGVMERLNLGPDDLFACNPRLAYGRMTGYGQQGVLSQKAGHDINYIAVSGALWPMAREGERPLPPMNLVGDFGGGSLFLVMGILAAVFSARETGEGQVVDVSMVDGSASMLTLLHSFLNAGYWREERGVNIVDSGAHFYEVYETRDGKFVAVGAIESEFYSQLLYGLGLDSADLPQQMDRSQWPSMKTRFASIFATRTRDEWTSTFENLDACVTPVLSPREAARHPYNTERDVFALEPVIQPLPAPRFSRTPGRIVGQNSAENPSDRLTRWGLDKEDIEKYSDRGAVA